MTRRSTAVLSCSALVLAASAFPTSSGAQEVLPEQGERIRVELGPAAAAAADFRSPWQGTFMMFQNEALIVRRAPNGAMRLPFDWVQSLEVERRRSTAYAVAKGSLAGGVFGVGMWQFLKLLCRSACDGGSTSAWLPATVAGGLVGLIVATKGRGHHWVPASLPR